MKNSKNELREMQNIHARACLNLLHEKGSQVWTEGEQAVYDQHIDAMSRLKNESASMEADRVISEVFVRKSPMVMSEAERRMVKNAMSTTTPSQGGYAVPSLVATEILSSQKDATVMRRAASQMFTGSGAPLGFPTSDGTAEEGEQLDQNNTATNLDPSFGTAPLTTYRYSSKIFAVPMELLQDMQADALAFVGERAMERIGRTQNKKFTIGTGTNEPTGFVPAAAVGKTGTTGQTLTIVYDDLVDMIESVDAGHQSLAWMMSQAMRKVVRKVKDATTNRPVWIPELEDTGASLGGSLLGYPVWVNNDMAAPAANAKSLAFGNFKKYMIRDAAEFRLLRFDDSAFALKGQVGFLAMIRSGGNLLDTGAVKVYQHSAT